MTIPGKNYNCDLIETLLWEKGIYFLRDFHLERMSCSAKHFVRHFDEEAILKALHATSLSFAQGQSYKVRLLLDRNGKPSAAYAPIENLPSFPIKVAFSEKQTDRNDEFLYHKTTDRALYDEASAEAQKRGLFDLIFTNKQGEVTEGAITNVMILKNGEYFTPPVFCGLLPGVYRKFLLDALPLPIKEKVLFKEDLLKADGLFVMNSVRKMLTVVLAERI